MLIVFVYFIRHDLYLIGHPAVYLNLLFDFHIVKDDQFENLEMLFFKSIFRQYNRISNMVMRVKIGIFGRNVVHSRGKKYAHTQRC